MNKHERLYNDIKILGKGKYELISEYKSYKEKVTIFHKECGKTYEVLASVFRNGRRCPHCNGGIKSNLKDFENKLKNKFGNEFLIVPGQEYVNSTTEMKFYHSKCKKDFTKKPVYLLQGHGCSNCSKTRRKTTDEFKKEVFNLVGHEYEVLTEYKNNKEKIIFRHNECKKEFSMVAKDFTKKDGNRCPYCKSSRGEKKIKEILDKKGLKYIHHFKDSNCRNKNILEFDFKIFLGDKFILLEYDGELHFKPWDNTEESKLHLEKQKENDKIKDKFCSDNNITLIRIPYWEKNNIEKIITEISTTIM